MRHCQDPPAFKSTRVRRVHRLFFSARISAKRLRRASNKRAQQDADETRPGLAQPAELERYRAMCIAYIARRLTCAACTTRASASHIPAGSARVAVAHRPAGRLFEFPRPPSAPQVLVYGAYISKPVVTAPPRHYLSRASAPIFIGEVIHEASSSSLLPYLPWAHTTRALSRGLERTSFLFPSSFRTRAPWPA